MFDVQVFFMILCFISYIALMIYGCKSCYNMFRKRRRKSGIAIFVILVVATIYSSILFSYGRPKNSLEYRKPVSYTQSKVYEFKHEQPRFESFEEKQHKMNMKIKQLEGK